MKKIVFIIMFFLIPAFVFADYTVIMKNGTELTGIKSYTEKGDEIYLYLETGYMIFPKKEILGIEGSETVEADESENKTDAEKAENQDREGIKERQLIQERTEEKQEASEKTRFNELANEYKSLMSEIRKLESAENLLVNQINEKTGKRFSYNTIQLKQLEKEIEPLNKELNEIRQKKAGLVKRKNAVEAELQDMK